YWTVPSAILERSVEQAAARRGVDLTAESARLVVPPGLRVEKCGFALPDCPGVIATAHRVTARPALWPLIGGRFALTARGEGYGGRIDGRAVFKNRFDLSGPVACEAEIDGVELGRAAWLEQLSGTRIEGTLSGVVSMAGEPRELLAGSGSAELVIEDGGLRFTEPWRGLSSIEFERVVVKADMKSLIVTVRSITFAGSGLEGSLSGTVRLRSRLAASVINLKGGVSVPALGGDVSLNVGGTIADPVVRIGRSS
ncbi:MAG TPA: type II secretion system protein GspN, partial [Deltaproteobacteria bacterium]|nr:type II secretion system protein GspN [Deltaproteobacteria bacterium]